MEAYTREQNVTVKAEKVRLVNTVIKAPVISLKVTHDEARALIVAIDAGSSDVAAAAVAILEKELEAPTEEGSEPAAAE